MLASVITPALLDKIMMALSTTLLYSLVLGIVLAAFAALVILLTRKTSSATRYNLLVGLLVLFNIASAVIFGREFSNIHRSAVALSTGNFTGSIYPATTVVTSPLQVQHNYLTDVSAYVANHHDTIVLIWFLIICIKAIQMGVGLQDVYRLKRRDTHQATEQWNTTVQQMARRLGITQKVELLESGAAKVPMVIGNLNPVILMPIGLLTALSTAEVEAILMHELAHISRRDYLVNLLQSFVEIIFFFNPAVLWVSHLIKIERENCCDDIALTNGTGKHNYIQALVSCEEYRQAKPAYAVALSGQKDSLMSRVKRMVNNSNHSLNTFEKTLLTICVVIIGLCLSAFEQKETIKNTIKQVVNTITQRDESKNNVAERVAPAPIRLKQKPAQIDTIPNNTNKQVPFDEAAWFRRVDSLKKSITTGGVIVNETSTVSVSVTNSPKTNTNALTRLDSANSSAPLTPPATTVNANTPKATGPIWEEMVKDGLMQEGKPVPFSINEKIFVVNGKVQSEALAQKYRALFKKDIPKFDRTQQRETINQIILEMAKDKLYTKGEDSFSFTLNNDEFIVNGKKQPDEVFQKYFNDFLKNAPGGQSGWNYSSVRTQ
ncbi:M56 family metallopeptidase [Mucilaginibacter calamicampi]|uniref:M56 family metallopeptidase n=1 Tax=Mucilaginibacter calamicampi TaxID=1302352 RepID=A0ABW2YYT8_9SPHI